MDIRIDLTEQEEKALHLICAGPGGISQKEFRTSLGLNSEESFHRLLLSLRGKGFKFDVQPEIKLSTDYAHYESLLRQMRK